MISSTLSFSFFLVATTLTDDPLMLCTIRLFANVSLRNGWLFPATTGTTITSEATHAATKDVQAVNCYFRYCLFPTLQICTDEFSYF